MKKTLIIANWKANPDTSEKAFSLAKKGEDAARKNKNIEVVIAPPFTFLGIVRKVLRRGGLGAQDVFWEDTGPYTGEISWRQLKSFGVSYVIVGHSERRRLGETDEMINKKVMTVLKSGMNAVLCVGERERGGEVSQEVGNQLRSALLEIPKKVVKNLVIAYEPVWAISTVPNSRPDTPDNAFRARVYIKRILTEYYGRKNADLIHIIYGGSVNAKNVGSFLKEGLLDGALVGGASLDPGEFAKVLLNAK